MGLCEKMKPGGHWCLCLSIRRSRFLSHRREGTGIHCFDQSRKHQLDDIDKRSEKGTRSKAHTVRVQVLVTEQRGMSLDEII